MSITYNEEIFRKHAAKSIQSADEIKVGDTLYSNFYPAEFTVFAILTDAEHRRRIDLDASTSDDAAPRWLQYDERDAWRSQSLHDCNIGAHYNPWLLFKNKEDCDACVAELKISFEPDPFEDPWEFDDDPIYEYEDAE